MSHASWLLCPCSAPAMLTPVSGSSSASVTASDKYAVFKQLSVDQPAEPTPHAPGIFHVHLIYRLYCLLSSQENL